MFRINHSGQSHNPLFTCSSIGMSNCGFFWWGLSPLEDFLPQMQQKQESQGDHWGLVGSATPSFWTNIVWLWEKWHPVPIANSQHIPHPWSTIAHHHNILNCSNRVQKHNCQKKSLLYFYIQGRWTYLGTQANGKALPSSTKLSGFASRKKMVQQAL